MTMPKMLTPPLPAEPARAIAPHSELIPRQRLLLQFLPALLIVLAAVAVFVHSDSRASEGLRAGLWGFSSGVLLSSSTLIFFFYSYQRRVAGGASRSASMRLIAALDLARTTALVEAALEGRNPRRPDARTFLFEAPRKLSGLGNFRAIRIALRNRGQPEELEADGEKIEISLSPEGSETAISVRSRSRSPLVLFDFGKNLQTVQKLGELIHSRLAQALAFERHELDAARKKYEGTEAQLGRLQAQHEAHFLFNTLAHVRILVGESPERAAEMLDALIPYLRSVSSNLSDEQTTLGREMEAVRGYLVVMSIRLGARLRYEVLCPEPLQTKAILAAAVLPLVENAVKHGVETTKTGAALKVTVRANEQQLFIEVLDTGPGFRSDTGTGSGLANLRARLLARYGRAASLTLSNNQPSGVIATLALPV